MRWAPFFSEQGWLPCSISCTRFFPSGSFTGTEQISPSLNPLLRLAIQIHFVTLFERGAFCGFGVPSVLWNFLFTSTTSTTSAWRKWTIQYLFSFRVRLKRDSGPVGWRCRKPGDIVPLLYLFLLSWSNHTRSRWKLFRWSRRWRVWLWLIAVDSGEIEGRLSHFEVKHPPLDATGGTKCEEQVAVCKPLDKVSRIVLAQELKVFVSEKELHTALSLKLIVHSL